MQWMLMPFRRYFEFSGRSRRREFWLFMLLNIVVAIILAGPVYYQMMQDIMVAASTADSDVAFEPDLGAGLMGSPVALTMLGLYGLYALFAFIPSIAVTVRRLHDRNMSGWWYLGFILLSLIPFVGFIAWIVFLVIMCLDGTPGTNRFGPDPKGRGSAEVFS